MLVTVLNQKLTETSSTAKHNLGDVYFDEWGNMWQYSQCSTVIAVDAVAQNVQIPLTCEDAAEISVVKTGYGGTATATHKYKGVDYAAKQILYYATGGLTPGAYRGYMGITSTGTTAGLLGQPFRIVNNSEDHFYLDRSLTSNLTDADDDIKVAHPHRVYEHPSNSVENVVGYTPIGVTAITDEYYFWRQVGGWVTVECTSAGVEGPIGVFDGDDEAVDIVGADETMDDMVLVGNVKDLLVNATNKGMWVQLYARP